MTLYAMVAMPDLQRYHLTPYLIKIYKFFIIDFFNCNLLIAHLYCGKKYISYNNLSLLNLEKRQYLPHYWSDKSFKYHAESEIGILFLRVKITVHLTLFTLGQFKTWNEMIHSVPFGRQDGLHTIYVNSNCLFSNAGKLL